MNSKNDRVIVVDDDAESRTSVRLILVEAGYEVLEAEDDDQTVAILTQACWCSLIICDPFGLKLKGMGTIDCFHSRFRKVPIIILSDKRSTLGPGAWLRKGVWDYLNKPVEPEHLIESVKKLFRPTGPPVPPFNPLEYFSPFFVILGFLDEYQGRWIIENGDRVETFYGKEKDKAEIFKAYLSKLVEQKAITTVIRTEVTEGQHIVFYSRELTELIDGSYSFDFSKGQAASFVGSSRATQAYISKEMFRDRAPADKLAFLTGAYIRYGKGDSFRFVNAHHKANLVAELLKEFDCGDVKVSLSGAIPKTITVSYIPSAVIKELFQQVSKRRSV